MDYMEICANRFACLFAKAYNFYLFPTSRGFGVWGLGFRVQDLGFGL